MAEEICRVERDEDGHPVWIHTCDEASLEFYEGGPARVTLPLGPQGWQWTDDGGLTLRPWKPRSPRSPHSRSSQA